MRKPVESSNINSLGWEDGTLEVEFKSGKVYKFFNVGEEVYKAFLGSPSKGKYFHQYIKGEFECEKPTDVRSAARLLELGLGLEVNQKLQDEAKRWITIYSEEDGRNEDARKTVRAFIKYFFELEE